LAGVEAGANMARTHNSIAEFQHFVGWVHSVGRVVLLDRVDMVCLLDYLYVPDLVGATTAPKLLKALVRQICL
jgi:hypothetical protein